MERRLLPLRPMVAAAWWMLLLTVWAMPVGLADARSPHHPHRPHNPRGPRGGGGGGGETPPAPANVLFAEERVIATPGRALAVSWSPDGDAIATGGHFVDRETGLRYDTRVYDVRDGHFERSYACHYFWVIATAWTRNPYVGDLIASGGGDHAVKLWNPSRPGSTRCEPGQFRPEDGAIKALPNVNGWTTAIAFSPDGRFVATASRDRAVRIWQVQPGPDQWRVIAAWYDRDAGNVLSVAWLPDGKGLVTGDRRGRIARWDLDPDTERWDAATVADYARISWDGQLPWFARNAAVASRAARWIDGGHGSVWTVRVAPDGATVAAAGSDGTVSVYDADGGAVRWRIVASGGRGYAGLDWHPDGSLLAAGRSDGDIDVFDAASGASRDRLVGHADDVAAVAWSPDGTRLASAAGGQRISFALLHEVGGPDTTVRVWRRR